MRNWFLLLARHQMLGFGRISILLQILIAFVGACNSFLIVGWRGFDRNLLARRVWIDEGDLARCISLMVLATVIIPGFVAYRRVSKSLSDTDSFELHYAPSTLCIVSHFLSTVLLVGAFFLSLKVRARFGESVELIGKELVLDYDVHPFLLVFSAN